MKLGEDGLKQIIKEEFKKIMEGLDVEFMKSVSDKVKSRGPKGTKARYIPTKRKDPNRGLLKINTFSGQYEVLLSMTGDNEVTGEIFGSDGNKFSEFVTLRSEIVDEVVEFLKSRS